MRILSFIPWVIGRVVHGRECTIPPVGWTRNRGLPRPDISLIAGLVIPLLLSAAVGLAQTVDTAVLGTNGPVNIIVNDGGTIYIGGDFTSIGPLTGGGVAIDASTGAVHRPYPQVAGAVNVVAPDGSGGWYLGGSFTAVGGQPRNNLAQLDAGGNLTPWNPSADGQVYALVVSGSTVYAGGLFTSIGGQSRNNIAALDVVSGVASGWNPNASSYVEALAVSGGTVYAGGQFITIGGQPRGKIAALDAASGAVTAWNPNARDVNGSTYGSAVYALVVSDGTVYAGGQFSSIGGQFRSNIAALDASGAATAWNPSATGGQGYGDAISALAVSGGTVYAAGGFTSIGGQPRNDIAALDVATGAATNWDPNANDHVYSMVVSGATVYIGGDFTSVGGEARSNVAALDAATGATTAWNPSANGNVTALAVSGSTVFAGGQFTIVGAGARNRIAALDAATGAVTAWNPNADGPVYALAVSGSTIYAGGLFTSIGGQLRNNVAALDAATGGATAWNPNASSYVEALAVSGGTVYAGGQFTTIGGQQRSKIAALDAASGDATTWDPNARDANGNTYNSAVYALVVSGGTVFAGGQFSSIGGQPRRNIAALDAASGGAAAWNPSASGGQGYGDAISAMAVSGGTVYAAGGFSSIGGQPRNNIAALDAASGAATGWDPNANGHVSSIAVSGATVYIGGGFTSVGGQLRSKIAALNAATGAAPTWDPGANNWVTALDVYGGRLYAGGQFTSIGGLPQPYLAALFISTPCPSVAMSLDLNPNTLNLQSMGHWVTATLEPEPPALPSDIDIASIRLNGSVPVDASAPTAIGDADSDGRPDLTVKFDRAAVELAVAEGDAVPVTVSGEIGNGCFTATDVIRIIRGHVTAPTAGAVLQGGSTAEVRWDTPAGVQVQSVAVLWSSDDGASWSLVANGLPNSSSYSWSLPNSGTSAARVAVVLVESADPSGYEVTGVLGVSGRFAITTPLAVVGPGVELALHGPVANPSTRLTVSFSLPNAEPASLVVYDVSGRELVRNPVGTMGAGRHVVTLGTSPTLAPGVYLVRLIRGDQRLVARAVVIR